MIAGDSVSGKSYAVARKARAAFEYAQQTDTTPPKFFWHDTDDTLPTFLNPGDEFEDLLYSNGGNIYPYPAFNWDDAAAAYKAIHAQATGNDWIVIDVLNRLYDWAQLKVAQLYHIDIDDTFAQRALSKQGFGAFNADQWQLVVRIFESIINPAVFATHANLVVLSHLTEMSQTTQRPERRELMLLFDALGFKPRGAPKVPSMMDTVMILWAVRRVPRDENNRRIGSGETVRNITLLKDRGRDAREDLIYDRDAIDALFAFRKTKHESHNVTDPKLAAEIMAHAEAVVASRSADLTDTGTDTAARTSTSANDVETEAEAVRDD
jgi:hypothetical protein